MSRFDISLYNPFNLDVIHSNRIQAHTGNFISNPGAFDNKFFNISPREAKTMDPQQRILLHTAQEALEDAGYVPDATKSYRRGGFGCYIGAATGDYAANLEEDVDVYCSTGAHLFSFLLEILLTKIGLFRKPSIFSQWSHLLRDEMERTFSCC